MQKSQIQAILDCKFKQIKRTEKARFKVWVEQILSFDLTTSFDQYSPALMAEMLSQFWLGCNQRCPEDIFVDVFQPDHEVGNDHQHTTLLINMQDMPFVVDTVRLVLSRNDHDLYAFINASDVRILRQDKGRIKSVDVDKKGAQPELFLIVSVNRITDPGELKSLIRRLQFALQDVELAVADWHKMQARMSIAISNLTAIHDPELTTHRDEAIDFMKWLLKFFTFIGYREYQASSESNALTFCADSPLGVLRANHFSPEQVDPSSPPTLFDAKSIERFIVVGKSKLRSTIHRPPYTDVIVVRLHNDMGVFTGEMRFVGLFTSNAYESDPMVIPFLRNKTQRILSQFHVSDVHGYTKKRLYDILRTFPRDELYQADVAVLAPMVQGVLSLQNSREVRFFVRRDKFKRFISCIVYLPKANYTQELIEQLHKFLKESYAAKDVVMTTQPTEHAHVCMYFVLRVDQDKTNKASDRKVAAAIQNMSQSWHDLLHAAAIGKYGEEKGVGQFKAIRHRFPAQYREIFEPNDALEDVLHMACLSQANPLHMGASWQQDQKVLKIKAYQFEPMLTLSDVLPIFENLGLQLKHELGAPIWCEQRHEKRWVSEFRTMLSRPASHMSDATIAQLLKSFQSIYTHQTTNDVFNGLTPVANFTWQQVRIIRAMFHYLKQIGLTLSEQFVASTLMHYPAVTIALIEFFAVRFEPKLDWSLEQRAKSETAQKNKLLKLLETIHTSDEDKVYRSFLNLMEATVRTNAYALDKDGHTLAFISFKIESSHVLEIPQPAPRYETFTFSRDFSGVHLRADKVARGGLRWSDREDFRKEILDLMKAQQVKNALIVPSGAKGGFLIKKNMSGWSRDAIYQEGVRCYQQFIRSLLMLTDNIVDGQCIPPNNIVCHDDVDSYLVVAADKGTASFSDIANAISHEYHFWLKDAFASGGSNGYDHKKMGITAKGAWEAVKWHFHELGIDMSKTPFSVVGIGGMAGDVFGNGMLLSENIQLVAAFNHQYIFLDPNPCPKNSFKERRRLFQKPNSMWSDYNEKLLSRGGGIFSRTEREIQLSPEICQTLGIVNRTKMGPSELIQAILMAPVDLLWNGGIGTYVKASHQHHNDVGDHSNDRLRIDAKALRCRVFAEGGNLGITQLGRIEAELSGVKINTDFIDNSAGVDCSDHEVNIKIFLNQLTESKQLTSQQRDDYLLAMTDEVAGLVLQNNRLQNMALSLASAVLPEHLYLYERFMDWAVSQNYLNKDLEFLPAAKVLKERAALGKTLTRPELSILLTYSKIILQKQMIESGFSASSLVADYAWQGLPRSLRERFPEQMASHPLRQEMVATQLSGDFIQDLGLTFIPEIKDEVDITIDQIIASYLFIKQYFDLPGLHLALDQLEHVMSFEEIMTLRVQLRILLRRSTRWLLRHPNIDVFDESILARFKAKRADLLPVMPDLLSGQQHDAYHNAQATLAKHAVPGDVMEKIGHIYLLFPSLNVIDTALRCNADVVQLAKLSSFLSEKLKFGLLRTALSYNNFSSRWSVISRFKLKGIIDHLQSTITSDVYHGLLQSKIPENLQDVLDQLQQFSPKVYRDWQSASLLLQQDAKLEFEVLYVLVADLEKFALQISQLCHKNHES